MHQVLTKELNKFPHLIKIKAYLLLIYFTYLSQCKDVCISPAITLMLKGREEQWQELKELVTNIIVQHNGSVSHHHSVKRIIKKCGKLFTDALALDILKSIKINWIQKEL
ncbi:MAG: FAD-linked oxidase C-terminal domain-containing protein [Chitinophagales bacterium]